jgi:hypothetical protein
MPPISIPGSNRWFANGDVGVATGEGVDLTNKELKETQVVEGSGILTVGKGQCMRAVFTI